MTNEEYVKMVADAAAREEKRTADFMKAVERGEYIYFSQGSERGYLAKRYYPNGKFCGIVRHGFRAGLYKFQKSGLGGPHGNSSQHITNVYYRKVEG